MKRLAPDRLAVGAVISVLAVLASGCAADPLTPGPAAEAPGAPVPSATFSIDPTTVPGLEARRLVRSGTNPLTVETLHLDGATELDQALDTLTLATIDRFLAGRSAARYEPHLAPWGLAVDADGTLPTDSSGLVTSTDLVAAAGSILGFRVTATEDGAIVSDAVAYWDDATRTLTPAADLVPEAERAELTSAFGGGGGVSLDSLAFAADGSASVRVPGDTTETSLTLPAERIAPFLTDAGRAVQSAVRSSAAFEPSPNASTAQPYVPCALIACVALTFDDGPSPDTTPGLLDLLKDEGVHATFFVEGRWAQAYPDLVRREVAEGHSVENHTWDHPDLATLPADQVAAQIQSTDQAIEAAGVPAPTFIRAPYGSAGGAVAQTVDKPLVFWSIDAFDWRDQQPGVFVPRLLDGLEPGGIALMHDIYPSTVEGQRLLIGTLRDRGYTFVTVPQLFAGVPTQAGTTYSCLGDGLAATGPACTVAPVSRTP